MSGQRWRGRVWSLVAAAATVSLVVAGALIGVTDGTARAAWTLIAVALTVLQLVAQWRRRAAAERSRLDLEQLAENIRTSTNYAISDAFMPLLRLVTALFEASDDARRATLRAQIETSVAYAAAASIGPDHAVRACVFRLTAAGGDRRQLRWTGTLAGRMDEPRSPFLAGTVSGDAAIAMVLDDSYLYRRDIRRDPPPGWDGHAPVYRTFLAVPVRGIDHASGMLTVDSLHPGDLDPDRDRPILTVLARILAISQFSAHR